MPTLRSRFPELTPYLLLKALPYEVDTNSSMVKAFRESLEQCAQDPSKVPQPKSYFEQLMWDPYRWAFNSRVYDLVIRMAAAHERAAAAGLIDKLSSAEKVRVVYAEIGQEKWKEALALIESLGDQAVNVSNLGEGPWGSPFDPVLPARLAQECRTHLGVPSRATNLEFELGPAFKTLETPFAFLAEAKMVWLAEGDSLSCFGPSGEKMKEITTPNAPDVKVTCMCATPGRIWIGTQGEGLIEYNVATGACRPLKVKDGLLLNNISCLFPQGEVLWVGFGRQTGASWQGGIGRVELGTYRATALTRRLDVGAVGSGNPSAIKESLDGPPVGKVVAVAAGSPGELWVAVREKGIQRYQIAADKWETFQSSDQQNLLSSLVADREQVFAGCYDPSFDGEKSTRGGLAIHSFRSPSWQTLRTSQGLPANQVTALALDGTRLWVGGFGFIEAMDAHDKKVQKRCYVASHSVDALQVAGGILWVKISENLYRIRTPVSDATAHELTTAR